MNEDTCKSKMMEMDERSIISIFLFILCKVNE